MAPITWLVCLLSTLVVTTVVQSWDCWDSATPDPKDYPETIDDSQVCDTIRDCIVGEDEVCFTCADGQKITEEILFTYPDGHEDAKVRICDGNPDCADGSDEIFCYVCADSSSFYNKDNVCISNQCSGSQSNCDSSAPSSAPSVSLQVTEIKTMVLTGDYTAFEQYATDKDITLKEGGLEIIQAIFRTADDPAKAAELTNIIITVINVFRSSIGVKFSMTSDQSTIDAADHTFQDVIDNNIEIKVGPFTLIGKDIISSSEQPKSGAYKKGYYENLRFLCWIMLLYICS